MIVKIKPANIRRMVKKEFLQLFRDRKLRLFIIAPPVLMLFVFGYAVNTDVNRVMIAVLDEDRSFMSRDFIARFTVSPYFSCYASVSSADEAAEMLDRGEADLFLHVERDFSRRIKKNSTGHVQAIVDGSDSTRASVIISYINSIMASFAMEKMSQRVRLGVMAHNSAGRALKGLVEMKERIYFNQDLLSGNFYLPGVIGLLIALITIMLTSMSIVKERESGTIEQINVSPLRPLEYIMGKTMPFAMVAFMDIILISLLTIAWFDVPFRGSFIFLLASGFFFILSTIAVGLFISTISMTQQQAMLSSFLFFIPSILLSGYIFPVYSMPEPEQLLIISSDAILYNCAAFVFLKASGSRCCGPRCEHCPS
jgi:ABC-2 type transport system permease protein